MDLTPIFLEYPNLAKLPRRSWRSSKAWRRLRRAKPFLLDAQDGVTHFVDSGGWAHRLDDLRAPSMHASKLLTQGKKSRR